ncbi:hypothetical protein [Ligilactobacillus acidipiscis]|uniref:Uncharacterized protein n=1 Tax=Ligilactobacillus acidipiscis TaxID=89059 RepID=A0A921F8C7_9LACO|nr:hypothetical protein [Ligilactobacillus acidipiscis]WEV57866.1 hypothetical protein OZX66_04825 [Ligilactobacillus acidipiscis]HJE97265.1 hypothetical protein [Ligilactobacillus acidipiscis]
MTYDEILNTCILECKKIEASLPNKNYQRLNAERDIGDLLTYFFKAIDGPTSHEINEINNLNIIDNQVKFCSGLRFVFNNFKHNNLIIYVKRQNPAFVGQSTVGGEDVIEGGIRWAIDTHNPNLENAYVHQMKNYNVYIKPLGIRESIDQILKVCNGLKEKYL